ncbi:hypothetical protein TcasGA2_TC032892 [Tribolium castaneum]|uniref:Uncharacterized protein n=1 Tax=Tribolium castaneum TaxID=7070 RepID=A0A139WJN6_TRICA|nr:hypothetical protein TcasGA2_TC032892 [Tribolium castaneum]
MRTETATTTVWVYRDVQCYLGDVTKDKDGVTKLNKARHNLGSESLIKTRTLAGGEARGWCPRHRTSMAANPPGPAGKVRRERNPAASEFLQLSCPSDGSSNQILEAFEELCTH